MTRARKKSKPPQPLRSGKKEPGWQATPRQIRLPLLIGGAVILMMVGTIVVFSLPHRLTQQERVFIEHYESVRTALSRDDLAAAHAAASVLADFSRDNKRIMVGALARASSLSAARDAFQAINSRVIKLASGNRGYYRFGCSMAACPEVASLATRLNMAIGFKHLIEEDRYCVNILNQISAVRSALDAVGVELLTNHVESCVLGHGSSTQHKKAKLMKPAELVTEMRTALTRFLR